MEISQLVEKDKNYAPGMNSGFKEGDIYIGRNGSGIIKHTEHFLGCFIHYETFNEIEDKNYANKRGLRVADLHSDKGTFSDKGAIFRKDKDGNIELIAFSKEVRDDIDKYYQTLENKSREENK
ncbi:MAG: hypothetical protein KC516_03605 [Nanoarchaeota archaeon]|nr:hypothetical protein [Nanoarchaeota archaeon]